MSAVRFVLSGSIAAGLLLQGLAFSHAHANGAQQVEHDLHPHFHWHEHDHSSAAPHDGRHHDRHSGDGDRGFDASHDHDADAVYVGSQVNSVPKRELAGEDASRSAPCLPIAAATLSAQQRSAAIRGHDPPGASPPGRPLFLTHLELRL